MRYVITMPQAICEQGRRPNQEDSIWPQKGLATDADRLFLICDGMGGHESGEVASGIVCQTVSSFVCSAVANGMTFGDDLLRSALSAAYDELDANDQGHSEGRAMGTTLALLFMGCGGVMVAHIGDSRIYHIRPSRREILYRSRDHSLVHDLFLAGEITEQQMAAHPQKNVLTRCMMPHQERRSEADVARLTDVRPDDYFFLCSDGMLESMSDSQLIDIICDEDETDEMKAVILRKYTQNNSDNHSAYLIHVKETVQEIADTKSAADKAVDVKSCVENADEANAAYIRKKRLGWIWPLLIALFVLACLGVFHSTLHKDAEETRPRVESDFRDPQKNIKTKTTQRRKSVKRTNNKKKVTVGDEEQKSIDKKSTRPLFMDNYGNKEDKNAMEKMKDIEPKKKEEETTPYNPVSI